MPSLIEQLERVHAEHPRLFVALFWAIVILSWIVLVINLTAGKC